MALPTQRDVLLDSSEDEMSEQKQEPRTGQPRARPKRETLPPAKCQRLSTEAFNSSIANEAEPTEIGSAEPASDHDSAEEPLFDEDKFQNFMKYANFPSLSHLKMEVPPLRLVQLVLSFGGFSKVSVSRLWAEIIRELVISQNTTSSSTRVKSFYREHLLRFETIRKGIAGASKTEPLPTPPALALDENIKTEEQLLRFISEIAEQMVNCELKHRLTGLQKQLEDLPPAKVALLAPNKTGKSLLLDLMLVITEKGQVSYKQQASDMTALDQFLRESCEVTEDEVFF
eukprot:m.269596 g.269596  ORF g.269596 m.269596 type:complete len:286 (-) comp11081_c0_seq70:3286-4143(-)